MKNLVLLKSGILLVVTILFFSCSNDDVIDNQDIFNLVLDTSVGKHSTLGLDNLDNEFEDYWNYGLKTFGLSQLCGCECSDAMIIPDFWLNGRDLLPSILSEETVEMKSCEMLKFAYKQRCNHSNLFDFKNQVFDELKPIDNITIEEINLINNMISEMIQTDDVNIDLYRSEWNNLLTTSDINNIFSLVLIETISSLLNYRLNNPTVLDDLDDTQAWVWKAIGAVRGALVGVLYDPIRDSISDTGYQGSGSEIAEAALKGAIIGAVTSL